jgi:hypothetical protein
MFNALLVRLTAGQIFLFGTLNGGNILPHATLTTPGVTTLAALFVIAGVTVVIYAMVSSPLELKFFIAFAALVFAAAVRRLHCDSGWDWASMMTTGYAIRYWYVPRLAALAILVWMIERRQPIWIRALAGAAILLVTASSFRHWQYQPWPYQDFRRNARSFERATKGTQISIPVNPPGWKIILIKH